MPERDVSFKKGDVVAYILGKHKGIGIIKGQRHPDLYKLLCPGEFSDVHVFSRDMAHLNQTKTTNVFDWLLTLK